MDHQLAETLDGRFSRIASRCANAPVPSHEWVFKARSSVQ